MDLCSTEFKRKCSTSLYKNLKLSLAEMAFFKDFVNDTRGDLYPVLQKEETCLEKVQHNLYTIEMGGIKRLFCQFFPYATYEITAKIQNGEAGFCFCLPDTEARVIMTNTQLIYVCGAEKAAVKLPDYVREEATLIVSCRPGAFDVFFKTNEKAEFFHTFRETQFDNSNDQKVFQSSIVALWGKNCMIKEVRSYIDSGISLADMRSIRYENGDVMIEQGKIYLTASIRMQAEMFQGIFSWTPGTAEFALTGALFYDSGDGKWCGDVAASVLYHRAEKRWYLWVCSFAHDHILGHAVFDGDPRFGVNVVDLQLMERANAENSIEDFVGFTGDEDPDFFYDNKDQIWRMAICRVDPKTRLYRYVFFQSDKPFDGYQYVGCGKDGAETGGSFVKMNGELCFLCGNDYRAVSDYRIYKKEGMCRAKFNYPDGGFRGWGTLLPIKMGSRTRYFWLTFDRHNGSDYNWSYGNVYVFEGYDL